MTRRVDLLAVAGSVVALADAALYLVVIREQQGEAAVWVVATLLTAAGCAAYAAPRRSPQRRVVLGGCAVVLGALGLLALLSVGLPILVAAALCLAAAVRTPVGECQSRPRCYTLS
jgi:hypothetical protein